MNYASKEEIKRRFGEELEQVRPSPSALASALASADAEIDGHLRGNYSLPLKNKHELLTRIACDLARDYIYKDGGSAAIKTKADDARSKLNKISNGAIRLDETTPGQKVAGEPMVKAPDKVFGAGMWRP